MDFTPVSVRRTGGFLVQKVSSIADNEKPVPDPSTTQTSAPTSPEEALEVLRNEPSYDSLVEVLKWLERQKVEQRGCNINNPTPTASQIIQVLVTDIAPNYWAVFQGDASDTKLKKKISSTLQLFLGSVRSIPGINATLLRLRALTQEAKAEKKDVKRPDLVSNLKITLELLDEILKGRETVRRIWDESSSGCESPEQRRPLEQEFVTLLGSGRIISWAAEADEVLRTSSDAKRNDDARWMADGAQYSRWLGRNIARWFVREVSSQDLKLCAQLFSRSLRLGYADAIVTIMVDDPELKEYMKPDKMALLLNQMSALDQRKVMLSILKYFSDTHLNKLGKCESAQSKEVIAGATAYIRDIVKEPATKKDSKESKADHLVSWLTSSSGAGLGDGVGIRRAVMAVVAQDRDALISVLEKMIAQFGDALYIKHSPMLQQEAHTQVLLLCAGYVHRLVPTKLIMMTRYGPWLNAISNRLSASQERARFLGMVVGEAITGLYEKGDKKLDFHQEETKGEEGRWLKGLTTVDDKPGPLEALRKKQVVQEARSKPAALPQPKPQRTGPTRAPTQGFIIEEVDDDESEDDDLVTYAKPDSDEEDSDDDATLVQRNKPKAPVYIRDLIRYLRDSDNYDHQKLALNTAPSLIRRKGNFGTEVKEHADELAGLLIGLQDKFEIENFNDLRLQSMIALVVTQPEVMGQWFAKTFFNGDYSVSQRAAVLAVLGIGARELAGFETSQYTEASKFPSKTLPEKIERLFIGSQPTSTSSASHLKALPPNAVDTMAQSLTQAFLAPMAAEAADKATGPDVLKLATFASRLEQQQNDPPNVKRKPTSSSKPRIRAIPNTTAQTLYTSFFSPLAARFQAALRSSSSRTRAIVISQPHLLATYIRTLGIIAHAAGPGTLALPDMTAELWRLLLKARGAIGGDFGVVRAVLFALLALLEVNEARMRDICSEMGGEVVETMEWVSGVFDGTRGDEGEEGEVKMLAAAVLIRLRDGVEKYKALLMGDMIGI